MCSPADLRELGARPAHHHHGAALPLPERRRSHRLPGIREFALWHLEADRITRCFVEFRDYLGGCKFRDCTHKDDPGCALRAAVEAGAISADRFHNYHRILETMQEARHGRQQARL